MANMCEVFYLVKKKSIAVKTTSGFLQRVVLMTRKNTRMEGRGPITEIVALIQLDGLEDERRIWKMRPSGRR